MKESMMKRIMNYFAVKIQKNADLRYGREFITEFASKAFTDRGGKYIILDIGAGEGIDLGNINKRINSKIIRMYGVESYLPNCKVLDKKGIGTIEIDIEKERLPFEDASVDLIIANQIIEHTKEIFWIFSEISRVLKPGGKCVVGIPNLASFHNRIMLFLGIQPPCIDTVGPHVRGFTHNSFKDFIELDGYFEILDYKASNFYPFPPKLSNRLCKVFPKCGVALFFYIARTNKKGLYIDVLKQRFFETPYYTGN